MFYKCKLLILLWTIHAWMCFNFKKFFDQKYHIFIFIYNIIAMSFIWWRMPEFSNNLVCLIPLLFHNWEPTCIHLYSVSNIQPMDWAKTPPCILYFFYLFHSDVWRMEEKICSYFSFIATLISTINKTYQIHNVPTNLHCW